MFTIPSDNANYVFEGTLNSPQTFFGYGIKQYNNNDNTYYIRTLVNNTTPIKQTGIVTSTESNQNGSAYTTNTDVKCKMEYNNGTVKLYIDDVLLQTGQISFYPKYLTLINWTYAKTLTFKDIVIKPL